MIWKNAYEFKSEVDCPFQILYLLRKDPKWMKKRPGLAYWKEILLISFLCLKRCFVDTVFVFHDNDDDDIDDDHSIPNWAKTVRFISSELKCVKLNLKANYPWEVYLSSFCHLSFNLNVTLYLDLWKHLPFRVGFFLLSFYVWKHYWPLIPPSV